MTSAVGGVLPAEWAPQAKVMLTWPRRDGDFARNFQDVEDNFVAIACAIARFESLIIATAEDAAGLTARLIACGVPAERLRVFDCENDDVWARDHGPITVLRDGRALHLDFQFNGWGGKFPHRRDNALSRKLQALGAWSAPLKTVDFVLEGGALEVDGEGTLLTTERCLLAPTRNPTMSCEQIEALLRDTLGVRRILWLAHGDLQGDDTDGHIDTLARFCSPGTIAYQACEDRADVHFEDLAAMAEELRAFRRLSGEPYTLVPLPLPQAIHDADGRRLPAGYANFLIVNGAVLVPVYGGAADAVALERLRPYFPGRQVLGVNCRALIEQYGSLHCVTMQLPLLPTGADGDVG